MAARHFLRCESETLACHTLLEFGREEPVIPANEDVCGDGRPVCKVAPRLECRLGLTRLALRPGFVDHRLRHVVKELDQGSNGASGSRPS